MARFTVELIGVGDVQSIKKNQLVVEAISEDAAIEKLRDFVENLDTDLFLVNESSDEESGQFEEEQRKELEVLAYARADYKRMADGR